jgi:hypothetical protein
MKHKKKDEVHIHVLVSEDTRDQFREYAEKRETNVSNLIRTWILETLRKDKNSKNVQ